MVATDLSTNEPTRQLAKPQSVFLSYVGFVSAGAHSQLSHLRHDANHEYGDLRAALAVRVCPVAKASCRA